MGRQSQKQKEPTKKKAGEIQWCLFSKTQQPICFPLVIATVFPKTALKNCDNIPSILLVHASKGVSKERKGISYSQTEFFLHHAGCQKYSATIECFVLCLNHNFTK